MQYNYLCSSPSDECVSGLRSVVYNTKLQIQDVPVLLSASFFIHIIIEKLSVVFLYFNDKLLHRSVSLLY